jgi:dihydrofolate synthase/folylpolyglutamate synthase
MEIVHYKPTIIYDGATNPEGMKVGADSLRKMFPNKKIHYLIGLSMGKPIRDVISSAEKIAESMFFTNLPANHGIDAKKMFDECRIKNRFYYGNRLTALNACLDYAEENDVIVITGSFYLIGSLRKHVNRKFHL